MKKIIYTKNAPEPIGPYNQAILIDGTLYASGQVAINPENGQFENETIESETKRVLKNIEAVLRGANMVFSDIIKVSIFITNMDDFGIINEIYASCFTDYFPARETVQVVRLPKNARIEISVIAKKSN